MFQIITVSSSIGATNVDSGMEKGPEELAPYLLSKHSPTLYRNLISVSIPRPNPDHEHGEYQTSRYSPEIRAINEDLMRKVTTVIDKGRKPLVLMGDDSSAIGAVYGILQRQNIGIIWFDAHGDVNTPETSPSHCFYGMGLAHVLGYGHGDILEINPKEKFVSPRNAVMIGQRDLDSGEIDFIQRQNITVYSKSDFEEGIEEKVQELVAPFRRRGIKTVFLHYDLDVFDPSENPPVYAPTEDGLLATQIYQITGHLEDAFDIAGVSIANYIPDKDINDRFKPVIDNLVRRILSEEEKA